MKPKIFLPALATMLFAINSITAQNAPMEERAKQKVEETQALIVSENKGLALSQKQQDALYQLQLERMQATKNARKQGQDPKPINQKYFKIIFQDVLTPQQRKAFNSAKKKKGIE